MPELHVVKPAAGSGWPASAVYSTRLDEPPPRLVHLQTIRPSAAGGPLRPGSRATRPIVNSLIRPRWRADRYAPASCHRKKETAACRRTRARFTATCAIGKVIILKQNTKQQTEKKTMGGGRDLRRATGKSPGSRRRCRRRLFRSAQVEANRRSDAPNKYLRVSVAMCAVASDESS